MKNIFRFLTLVACFSLAEVSAQNAPVSIAAEVVSLETTASLPVYAMNFNDIGSFGLKLSYDPSLATASVVTPGPELGGMINTNLTTPGIVIIGWFTSGGVYLPDSSILFTVEFTRLSNGFSMVEWIDDGYSCEFYNSSYESLTDEPFSEFYRNGSLVFQADSAPVTTLPQVAATPGTSISIPVSVSEFNMIGSLALNLTYDPSVLTFESFSNESEFPGLMVDGSQPGIILAEGMVAGGDTAVTLENGAVLFTLNFSYLGGFTEFNWLDNGSSCHYTGSQPVYPLLNDTPQEDFYMDGSVSSSALPGSAGPITGPSEVCSGSQGIGYSVSPIAYATGYTWEVPQGAIIQSGQNTNAIVVGFGPDVVSGNISVYGFNNNGNGTPAVLGVTLLGFPGDAGPVSGFQEVCQGQTTVNYSTEPIEFATAYIWNLPPGASVTGGANTSSITVSFSNSANTGAVSVAGSNICGTGMISEPLHVMVYEIPWITQQPISPPAVYAGSGEARFALQASGSGLTYQWQEYSNYWTYLNENEMYAGVNTDTLHIINPAISMSGYRYRCVVSGQCEPSATTDGNASLTVLLPVGTIKNTHQQDLVVYPNPCSQETIVSFNLPGEGALSILLQNLMGETIQIMDQMVHCAGNHSVKINMSALASGIYTLSLLLKNDNNLMISRQKIVCSH